MRDIETRRPENRRRKRRLIESRTEKIELAAVIEESFLSLSLLPPPSVIYL